MMIRSRLAWFAVAVFLGALLVSGIHRQRAVALEYSASRAAPEFTHTTPGAWINSAPIKLADLKGKVVLIDFWTFDCWNCYRSFPWLHALEEQFSDQPFQVIGVHTPEFDHERVRDNVEKKVAKFRLTHPVMMDNDFSYWRAMNNRYWPAFYLIDKRGRVRARFVGETHSGDRNARAIETRLRELLAEAL
ncbi:MAG: redoxin domain-containing protein [Pseudomonadota bacterium]|nr:MAG: redoxin domain-containing protein [Pseudomonadota bacterium]